MKKVFLLALFVLGIGTTADAQGLKGQTLADSLIAELPNVKRDIDKAYRLNTIAWELRYVNPNLGLFYAKKAIALAQQIKDTVRLFYGYKSMIHCYTTLSEYSKAIVNTTEALAIAQAYGDEKLIASGYWASAIVYEEFNINKSLDYSLKAIEIYKRINKESEVINNLLGNVGMYYRRLGDFENAMLCLRASLEHNKNINETGKKAYAYRGIGQVFNDQEMYDSALYYYNKALVESKSRNMHVFRAYIFISVSDVYLNQKKYSKAINSLNDGLAIAKSTESLSLNRKCYQRLHDAYKGIGNKEKSLYAIEQYLVYKDSIDKKENKLNVASLEMQADFKSKQLVDSIQNVDAEKLAGVKLQKQRSYTLIGVGVAILLLAFSVFVFRNNKKLSIEKEKSETLLHNILPQEIAHELKERGATTAQQYNNVTVLFTDFVNFTSAGERMGSQGLVNELHNCFKAFDEIMGKYGIEKIKTIGDAYLAVCGLPTADEKHAEKVVMAAQEIRDFMVNRHQQLGDKTFEVRVGLHSGEVVAGIVGVKKFAYDIWGDTVNTAARMEQNSLAGKINISHTTYELVQNQFTCTYRGELEAKNKGKLKMYFVEV